MKCVERPSRPTTGDSPPPGTTGPWPSEIGEPARVGTPRLSPDEIEEERRNGVEETDETEERGNDGYAG